MKCPKCGKNLPFGAVTCGNCGAKFKTVKCPHCGRDILPGLPYCPGCQKDIKWSSGKPGEGLSPNKSKSLTSRWWFWAVCAVLALGVFVNIGSIVLHNSNVIKVNTVTASSGDSQTESSSVFNSPDSSPSSSVEAMPVETTPTPPPKEESGNESTSSAPKINNNDTEPPLESQVHTDSSAGDLPEPVITPEPTKAPEVPIEKPTKAPAPTKAPSPPTEPDEGTVYWTPNGEKYHSTPNCVSLKRSSNINSGTMEEAISNGHKEPCKLCH